MANTGTKVVLTLRKYVDGAPTGETKDNTFGDPDYIAPYEDLVDCPSGSEPTTTTSTTTISPTTTSPTTEAPSGTCRNIFVENTVDTSRYGVRWINPTNGLTESVFGNLFGTPTTIGGDAGVVYSVCATSIALTWDSVTNTLVTISGVTELAQGGTCTLDTGCEYIPPTTTTTPPTTYYTLSKCEDDGTQSAGFRSTQNTTQISLSVNERVHQTGDVNITYVVTGTTTNDTFGGIGVQTTGLTGCPPAYNYYFARECTDGARITDGALGDQVVRTINDYSSWSHILIPRFPGDTNAVFQLYSSATKAQYDANAGDYSSVDLDTISGVAERTSC